MKNLFPRFMPLVAALCAALFFQCSSDVEPLLTEDEYNNKVEDSSNISSDGSLSSSSSDVQDVSSSSLESSSSEYGEACGGYCLWDTGCYELRSDPDGIYNADRQPMDCQAQFENCSNWYSDSDCGGLAPSSSSSFGVSSSSSSSSRVSSSSQSSSSVVLPDPRPQSPEAMTSKTAMQYFADEGIKVGINLGNDLDAVDTWTNPSKPVAVEVAWGAPKATQVPFTGFKNLGFNIVRIPVTWFGHIGDAPDYKVEEARLRRVAEVVGYAKTAGLKAIINIMHDGHPDYSTGWLDIKKAVANTADRDRIATQYQAVWKQIAEYFKNYGDWLIFEGFNEIQDGNWGTGTAAEYAIINDWNQRFTNAVRSTGGNNAKRYLIYNGYNTSPAIAETSSPFKLPTDAGNSGRQIVGFHYYYPWAMAGEASDPNWSTEAADKTQISTTFSNMKTKFINNGIQVIISENGPARYVKNSANFATAKAKRLAYIDYYYSKAMENGLVPCYWDTGKWDPNFIEEGDFTLVDRTTGLPNSEESRAVIEHMIAAVNNKPVPSGGNLGSYSYGYEDNHEQAVWVLSPTNVTKAKVAGAKLVLKLSNAPAASLHFAWQDPDAELWWNDKAILGDLGGVLNSSDATWNSSTKTLTINMSAAKDYSTYFASATSLTFIIAYYLVGGSIDDLGIISADLE